MDINFLYFGECYNSGMTDEILYLLPERQGGAISTDMAAPATPPSPPVAAHVTDTPDNGDAMVTALADDLEYTLTVAQALERIASAQRQTPSARTIQRYCDEQRLASKKIRTTVGSEWLINETALADFIDAQPIVIAAASDASNSNMATSATPTPPPIRFHSADSPDNGVASVAAHAAMVTPEGETRTFTEVLIENASLIAEVEGKKALIKELTDDRDFLREEVREGRGTRNDVKNIAGQMLDTLKSIATARLFTSSPPTQDPIHTSVIDPDDGQNVGRG